MFRQKDPKPFPPVCGPSDPAQSRLSRVPPPTPRIIWRENSLRSNSSRQKVDSGLRLRRIRRRGCPQNEKPQIDLTIPNKLCFHFRVLSCVGRGWAAAPNPTSRRRLFEWRGGHAPRSEFLSHHDSGWRTRNPGELASEQDWRGRARAKMVLPPFAETKGGRLQGRNPANHHSRQKNSIKPIIVEQARVSMFEFRLYASTISDRVLSINANTSPRS